MSSISLAPAIHNNLLSLKRLSSQMSKVQQVLSTGKRVNSALDNASNYYRAQSLTNRAADLMELLNDMDKGIRTIEAATTGLDAGAAFLEQATAVATQALAASKIPTKEWFIERVGADGAVVSTAQELKDAIDSGKKTICIYGKIDYFADEGFSLKNNQKLVGTEYFTGYTGQEKFSQISFSGSMERAIEAVSGNVTIADISLSYDSRSTTAANLLYLNDSNSVLRNLDINFSADAAQIGSAQGAICVYGGNLQIEGVNNINGSGYFGGSVFLLESKAVLVEDAELNIQSRARYVGSLALYIGTVFDVYGRINIESDKSAIWMGSEQYSGNLLNIHETAVLNMSSEVQSFNVGSRYDSTGVVNRINAAAGARFNLFDGSGQSSVVSRGWEYENPLSSVQYINSRNILQTGYFEKTTEIDWDKWSAIELRRSAPSSGGQYEALLQGYDDVIRDSSYQGINLLTGGERTIGFNETRRHQFTVSGKDMSAAALGLEAGEWQTQGEIAESLNRIASALESIRGFQAELGTHYGIIRTRQDFTEALADVLESGAEELVLADMNEVTAEYLTLQTRQYLAVNALSLAAQSSRGILRLF